MTGAMLERAHWLWLADALGPAAQNVQALLEHIGEDILAFPEECRRAALRGLLTPPQLEKLRLMRPEDHIARLDECAKKDIRVVTWGDEAYPSLLRETFSPPLVLYYRGDISIANDGFLFAIIGTRRPSAYGVEATAMIARTLAKAGVVLVSGLATGLDSESHRAAVQEGTPTVACLAFGHMQCYPRENARLKEQIERQGLVLSEYPPDMPPMRQSFLQRNRLIAGLSHGVCVAEARERSGTLNTVRAALEANRDVFSVPGSIFSPLCEGTNRLLREGAYPVVRGEDILLHYGLAEPGEARRGRETADGKGRSAEEFPVSDAARKMRGALCASAALSLETLCEKTGLAPNQAMAALSELEMAGEVARLAGQQYQLK